MSARVIKMFDEKNRSDRDWRIYGGDNEAQVKAAIEPMGASFDCRRLAGFLFNEKLTKGNRASRGEDSFRIPIQSVARCRFRCGHQLLRANGLQAEPQGRGLSGQGQGRSRESGGDR